MELTPRQIVEELDKFIVGQAKAKRSVAVALRNRYRRSLLPLDLQEEIFPKNILMMGPTGVGKTEIARRLARLVNAPMVKVEATKFTEVGYVGRDVDSMVRDLVETSIRMVKAEKVNAVEAKARELARERLVSVLVPMPARERQAKNPLEMLFGTGRATPPDEADDKFQAQVAMAKERQERAIHDLDQGLLEEVMVEIEVEDSSVPKVEVFSGAGVEEMGINLQDILGPVMPKRKKKRKVRVREARKILEQEEAQKLVDMDAVTQEAIYRTEQHGIIFIDEIDKIAGRQAAGFGPDVSREGVQRDILPIVEGSTVMTKYGPVKTDHVLFIAAGAFHTTKPTDLIPELQGRLPIRVELDSLGEAEFGRILMEPKNALIRQYKSLLSTEGVDLQFTDDGVREIARMAARVNERTENIGARRLHTIMERLLEEVSFEAPEGKKGTLVVDAQYVQDKLASIIEDVDLSRYIL
ncbi:MAG: ATP-dependent protease ATPase subunit HslU [Bacillota bacterium]